ncbi:hypothetical protein BDA99DRAFT_491456 [Phascolomyces articulosus]|uniref:EamA domain-containing protein n=1 Tax=Phascolomyces articulosus TaxID=60185 RepID=A0AAD5KXW2_9FUNG|nr:hypothetical protein BDA99DRAFT_491456 [Phascolomyces articulosus]
MTQAKPIEIIRYYYNTQEQNNNDRKAYVAIGKHEEIGSSSDNERRPLLLSTSRPSTTLNNNNNSNRNVPSEMMGLFLMALCALAFASMTLFVKLSGASFPLFEIVFARSLIQTVLGLVSCLFAGIHPFGNRPVRPWLVFRGVIGGFALALNFFSVIHLSLVDTTAIMYLSPIITAILAALVLGESFYLLEGLCAAFCLTGALIVLKPEFLFELLLPLLTAPSHTDDKEQRGLAIFAAIGGAVLTAVVYCTIRKAGAKGPVHFLVHIVYLGAMGALISIPPLLTLQPFIRPKSWIEYGMLGMTGISAFIGQCLLSKGIQMAPAGPASFIRVGDIILAGVFDIFIFHEYPDCLSILGSIIIVGATTVLASRKWEAANEARRRR